MLRSEHGGLNETFADVAEKKIPTHSALLSQAASEWIEEHKQNKQYIV